MIIYLLDHGDDGVAIFWNTKRLPITNTQFRPLTVILGTNSPRNWSKHFFEKVGKIVRESKIRAHHS